MYNMLSNYVFTNRYYPSYIPQILLNQLARANSVPGIDKEVRTLAVQGQTVYLGKYDKQTKNFKKHEK